MILLISASWVARIIGVNHQGLATLGLLSKNLEDTYSLLTQLPFKVLGCSPFFGGTGVWTQGFALAKQMLYCLVFSFKTHTHTHTHTKKNRKHTHIHYTSQILMCRREHL
jgi:hypothetical protein